LLADAVTSTAAERQRVAVVVSHELAHQWSGDLVASARNKPFPTHLPTL